MVLYVVGSNPTTHPTFLRFPWRFHLAVRIPASHAGYTGSSPVGATLDQSSKGGWSFFILICFVVSCLFEGEVGKNLLELLGREGRELLEFGN